MKNQTTTLMYEGELYEITFDVITLQDKNAYFIGCEVVSVGRAVSETELQSLRFQDLAEKFRNRILVVCIDAITGKELP